MLNKWKMQVECLYLSCFVHSKCIYLFRTSLYCILPILKSLNDQLNPLDLLVLSKSFLFSCPLITMKTLINGPQIWTQSMHQLALQDSFCQGIAAMSKLMKYLRISILILLFYIRECSNWTKIEQFGIPWSTLSNIPGVSWMDHYWELGRLANFQIIKIHDDLR